MRDLPTGTVTFLFTDVEGSTRLWEELPDAMPACLARHDEILRDAIDAHGGVIVKTTGDGVHAAFTSAADGVAAAIDAQLAITSAAWDTVGGLRVRMGVHTGEAELRDGDYYGSAPNRAARLMSVAHGDQIVISHVTEDLARDSLSGGIDLLDLGEHRLRDLASPMHVFQIVHPELPREFPRLRSLETYSGNLPSQLTSFVGREEEIVALAAALADAPLVTLTGTGGVGKTRLAMQVAAEVVPRFPDGAWLCELATADDGELMVQVVATTIGCTQRPGLSLPESIAEYLKVRTLLLVLDNCEHLLDDVGDLVTLILRGCPGVKVLATSREALEVTGERVVRLRSLAAPDPDAATAELKGSTAVRLFADRARDAGAEGTWSEEQWRTIAEICRRVDGIPLAIELAAARVASMSPAEIAGHLDERFRLLTGKRRGRVERQQTLRATVDWSYQLLDDDDRAVFDRLGVFAGTFDAEGAAAVVSDDTLDAWRVIDSIASLVAKSMLVPEDGPAATTRYSMLETLRLFSREQLDQTDDADRWRRRHAQHFAEYAEVAAAGTQGADDSVWRARIFADLDNFRAMISWGLDREDRDDADPAVRAIVALAQFGQAHQTTSIAALSLRALPLVDGGPPVRRATVYALASYHEMNIGNAARARELGEVSVRDGVIVPSLHSYFPHQNLMFVELITGRYDRVQELLDDAHRTFGEIDHPFAEASLRTSMAIYESMLGLFADARVDAERAVELARMLRNQTLVEASLHGLAWALQRDEPEDAVRVLDEYLALVHDQPTTGISGSALGLAGGLRARLGDPFDALGYLQAGLVVTRDQGVRPQLAAVLDWGLQVLPRVGRPEAAARCYGALTSGALAIVSNYPLPTSTARTRVVERVSATLGADEVERLVAEGAAMPYDDLVAYAIEQLAPVEPEPAG
jgi:predicted ATPase/class 3 adenylate cyclase